MKYINIREGCNIINVEKINRKIRNKELLPTGCVQIFTGAFSANVVLIDFCTFNRIFENFFKRFSVDVNFDQTIFER